MTDDMNSGWAGRNCAGRFNEIKIRDISRDTVEYSTGLTLPIRYVFPYLARRLFLPCRRVGNNTTRNAESWEIGLSMFRLASLPATA
jgi:hypothetical protein